MPNLIDPENYCQFNDIPRLVDVGPDDIRKVATKMRDAHKQPGAILAFKAFTVLANRVERDLLKGQTSPCRRGCSICCHTLPPLYHVEMVALAREIKNTSAHTKSILEARGIEAENRIIGLETAYNGNGDGDVMERDYMDAFGPSGGVCPLLSADGSCMFYTHRPLACRLWSVVDDEPCVFGGYRHRAVAYPAIIRMHGILRLSGDKPYTPYNAIYRAISK